jgi:DNA-binding transcriptional LysR family regulator
MARNPITIEVLETLDAIDRRGSFAKAAEEMAKVTSAVSYAVQKLEEQLDITLFQRQGRRSVLTPAGRLVLAEGRDILKATVHLANKAKEVATGWEPHIMIGIEAHLPSAPFFGALNDFLKQHPGIEIDVCECVLNGGWEALEKSRVDLIVGSPGPVPLQKGYRAIPIGPADLVLVIASSHELASIANMAKDAKNQLTNLRRVVAHDTSVTGITRSAGLSSDGKRFYVQNIDQKVEAIRAGIGIGHLPRQRIQSLLDSGELAELGSADASVPESFIAWKISSKGKGLQALSRQLVAVFG